MHDKKHPRFEVFDIDQIVEAMIKYAHSEYDMDSLDQSGIYIPSLMLLIPCWILTLRNLL